MIQVLFFGAGKAIAVAFPAPNFSLEGNMQIVGITREAGELLARLKISENGIPITDCCQDSAASLERLGLARMDGGRRYGDPILLKASPAAWRVEVRLVQ